MRILGRLLFAFTIISLQPAYAVNLPAIDKDFACFSSAKANQYIRDFHVDLTTFGPIELCNGNTDIKKLFNDFQMVEEGHFTGSQTNIFIRNFVPTSDYFPWLQRMTRGVRRGHEVPYATAYNQNGYFTMQDGWTKLSTLGRVGTIIHEARHTEGYGHTDCKQGPYRDSGLPGCDQTLKAGGSHSVEMEYYSRVVLQGQNFHPVYQQMARLMNLARANFVFNDNPMQKRESLLAMTADSLMILDGSALTSLQLSVPFGFRLKRSSFGASLFSANQTLAVDLYENQISITPSDDEFSYFKIPQINILENVIDEQEVDVSGRRYFAALTKDGSLYGYNFKSGDWSKAIQTNGAVALVTTTPDGQEGLFLLNPRGELQPIDLRTMQIGGRLQSQWPVDVINYVIWNQQLLRLAIDGKVLDATTGQPVAEFAGQTVAQLIRAPLYDAY